MPVGGLRRRPLHRGLEVGVLPDAPDAARIDALEALAILLGLERGGAVRAERYRDIRQLRAALGARRALGCGGGRRLGHGSRGETIVRVRWSPGVAVHRHERFGHARAGEVRPGG